MHAFDRITMQEAEEKIKYYEEIFDIVRLLKGEDVEKLFTQEQGDVSVSPTEACPCYSFWEKNHPCDNCSSIKALRQKTQKIKLEFLNTQVYQVISRYLEIDGQPYIMELITRLEEETLVDLEGRDKLVSKLTTGYNEKLYKDALTGAYNRLYFEEEVKKWTEDVGIVVMDLDDFKLCNDTYGHLTGDMVLVTVSNAIRKCIRKGDTFVRYGGDEFVLVFQGIDEEQMLHKLQEIQKKIHRAVIPGYSNLQLSVSIGAVISKNEALEHALGRADRLMYQAKTEKNIIVTESNRVDRDGKICPQVSPRKMLPQILVVDDAEINREILQEILCEEYHVLQAATGEECVEMLESRGPSISLILLDVVLPGMDGFDVLMYMKRKQWIEDIPVIMMSGDYFPNAVSRAYELGAVDFIRKPYDVKIVYQRVANTIKLYAKQRRLMALISDQINEKEKNNQIMIHILSHIVEFRNGESGSHVLHINQITEMLLERLLQKTEKYPVDGVTFSMIVTASALHDIGKIGVDEKILNKPGRLTPEEFEIMKTHTVIGAKMLEELGVYQNEPLVKVAHEICRWHHERYDGKGYPDGLKGDEIPISAQVVSVADVYDALVSDRVYKKAIPHEEALDMILHGACGQFHPILMECLQEISQQIKSECYEG